MKPYEITLCYRCLQDFLEARNVRRKDKNQTIKDICCVCQVGYGYDYIVSDKKKSAPEDADL
jgi:hypothetical protein